MAKVYIDKDTHYSIFILDKEVIDALGFEPKPLTEIPDELLEEYKRVSIARSAILSKLEPYYESKYHN